LQNGIIHAAMEKTMNAGVNKNARKHNKIIASALNSTTFSPFGSEIYPCNQDFWKYLLQCNSIFINGFNVMRKEFCL
jgi:hypothetical protein